MEATTETSKALTLLRETIPSNEKAAQGSGVSLNTAWLADLYGYRPWAWGEDVPLSLDEALKLSAVLICMDVLAQDIAKTPLKLRRKLPDGGSEVVKPSEHWLAKLLELEPNEHHTWFEFLEMIVLHLGAVQNGFIAKRMTASGRTTALIPVLPGRVRILVDVDQGNYLYDISKHTPHEKVMLRGIDDLLLEDEIIHIRGRMFDGLFGYSNLEAGSSTMGLSKALQDYQKRLYQNDAAVRGVFQMKNEQALSEPAFKRLKAQLSERYRNLSKSGDPIILEEGMEFKSVSMNADQAEMAKAFDKAIESTARLFRIPPHKLMHLVAVKYENLEAIEKMYAHDTLIPIAERIEQKLARGLLSEKERLEMFLQFDRESMIITDAGQQAEMMKVLLNNAAMTINEARMKRGYNPIKGGDVRLVPANYSLVDADNNPVLETGQNNPAPVGEDNNKKSADLLVLAGGKE